jgi:hypothetical protein
VRPQIDEFGLAEIVDTIAPIGCIMAATDSATRRGARRRGRGSARDERPPSFVVARLDRAIQ